MEMGRRVKEQLKKMGGLEYWDTSFSYIDLETGQESYVTVPELGGGYLILEGQLPPRKRLYHRNGSRRPPPGAVLDSDPNQSGIRPHHSFG
jgi:hypothetical protein